MEKIDFKKALKQLYGPPANFVLVDVPSMQFVQIDGMGDPNTSAEYANGVGWLFSVSYALKFMSKRALAIDYTVPPLEGLWWAADMAAFSAGNRDEWLWTQMIMAPDFVTAEMFAKAVETTRAKLGNCPVSLRLARFDEGLSVQILHVGSYADEAPTIRRLHEEYLPQNGLVEAGHHHEIYLSDPRRVAPEKLRTVIRQPVRRR